MQSRKYGCWHVGCSAALLALVLAFAWPDCVSQVSPDGRLVARMTATSVLQRVVGIKGFLSVSLYERETGKHIYVTRFYVGDAWDNDFPYTVVWHPDARRFACILVSSEIGGFAAHVFEFDVTKHTAQPGNDRWLKPELVRRLIGSSQAERDEANEILQRDYRL